MNISRKEYLLLKTINSCIEHGAWGLQHNVDGRGVQGVGACYLQHIYNNETLDILGDLFQRRLIKPNLRSVVDQSINFAYCCFGREIVEPLPNGFRCGCGARVEYDIHSESRSDQRLNSLEILSDRQDQLSYIHHGVPILTTGLSTS